MKKLVFMMLLIFCTACGNEIVNNYNENKNLEKVKGSIEQEDEKQIINVDVDKNKSNEDTENNTKVEARDEDKENFYTELNNGEIIMEYNDKIYFSDGNDIYEISNDLSSSKVLLNDSDSFIIKDNVLYTNKASVNLTNGTVKELDELIYLDNEIIEYDEKFSKDYSIKFDDKYLVIMWKNGSIAHRRKLQPNSDEKEILHWNDGSIIELKDYLYVNEILYINGEIGKRRDYFINKGENSVVIFKDGRFVEFDNDYKIPVAEEECVFINSIIPKGEDFLVKATIYEKFTLSEEELKEKMEKNDEICIDGNLYKVVKLNNEYCLKTDVDNNYVRLNTQGNPFIIDMDDIDFFAYKITDKKVEFLLEEEASLTGNQYGVLIKEIGDVRWLEGDQTEDKFITFEHGIYHTFFDPETGKCAELRSLRIRG